MKTKLSWELNKMAANAINTRAPLRSEPTAEQTSYFQSEVSPDPHVYVLKVK